MSEAPTRTQAWTRSLAAVASGSAIPYGFTVTLWSSGAVLTHAHGAPDIGQIALFMAGALGGYSLFGAAARRWSGGSGTEIAADVRIAAGMFNWLAVAGGVGAAWLCSLLAPAPAWLLGSATATGAYLTLAAVQLAGVHHTHVR